MEPGLHVVLAWYCIRKTLCSGSARQLALFELHDDTGTVTGRWFGGGSDITPYYLFEEDVHHFHAAFKNAMDPFGKELYPVYKSNAMNIF